MITAGHLQASTLDLPTLAFVAVCVAGLLGVFLVCAWLQQRNVRALAWWGSAYLIGASAIALWGAPSPIFKLPAEYAEALTFVACGMIWNGVRLFHGRRLLPFPGFAGAALWLVLCHTGIAAEGSDARIGFGVLVVATYTFFIAFELRRERRKSLYSRTAAILVPSLHAAIFLMPLVMEAVTGDAFATGWFTAFAVETMLYAVGAAFIVLLMVKDHHVQVYRTAAATDPLTGLYNRGAFMENALAMCAQQSKLGAPVTLMMFDLDHFKSINDRFGHAVGDEVLKTFAEVIRSGTRATDIVGRLGGEEFAAIVPEPIEAAGIIAERLRSAFQVAGIAVGEYGVGATVSIGAAVSYEPAMGLESLLARADAALYRAKHEGRNRFCGVDDEAGRERARQAAISGPRGARKGRLLQRKPAG